MDTVSTIGNWEQILCPHCRKINRHPHLGAFVRLDGLPAFFEKPCRLCHQTIYYQSICDSRCATDVRVWARTEENPLELVVLVELMELVLADGVDDAKK